MLEANGWDASEAVELTKWWKTLSKCDIPAAATALSHGQSLAVLFKRAISIRNCAVHRSPQIPVKKVEEMVRDAWLLSQALQDDLRAAQLLHWHKELENLVAHLQLITNSQREAAEAELRSIHNAKVEIEERLAELESRADQLTQSLEAEGRTHRPINIKALQSLEQALSRPALPKALPVIALDQAWHWIGNSVGMIMNLKYAGSSEKPNC
jgi:phenylpropionate dioxygenase-like ring-hydroxylating dioxygenase large terminal subunit